MLQVSSCRFPYDGFPDTMEKQFRAGDCRPRATRLEISTSSGPPRAPACHNQPSSWEFPEASTPARDWLISLVSLIRLRHTEGINKAYLFMCLWRFSQRRLVEGKSLLTLTVDSPSPIPRLSTKGKRRKRAECQHPSVCRSISQMWAHAVQVHTVMDWELKQTFLRLFLTGSTALRKVAGTCPRHPLSPSQTSLCLQPKGHVLSLSAHSFFWGGGGGRF